MIKLFTSIFIGVFFFVTPMLRAQSSIEQNTGSIEYYSYSDTESKPETPTSTEKLYYDANGLKVMSVSSYSMYKYTYDANDVLTQKDYYYTSGDVWELSSSYTYVYDESGNVTRENQLGTDGTLAYYSLYEGYTNGVYTDYKSMTIDGEVSYWLHNENTFENGLLTEQVQYNKSSAEDEGTILSKTDYSYTDGVLTTETNYSYDSSTSTYTESGTVSYTYNSDGQVSEKSEVTVYSYGEYSYTYYSDYDYSYNDYSSAYAPTNLSVTDGSETNTLDLSWDAATSSDVNGYMVFVDDILEDVVTSTSYTSSVLTNGDHIVAVVAVVNGEASNISDIKTASVKDEGILAPENFRVVSISEVNEDGSYDVEVAWDAPSTNSTLTGYEVYYYSQYYYVEVEPGVTTTTINLDSYYTTTTDEYGDEVGVDIDFYAKAVYNTGTSESSNVMTVNCVDGTYTGIEDVVSKAVSVAVYPNPASRYVNFSEPVAVKIYTLTGKLALADASFVDKLNVESLSKGIYIVETTTLSGVKTQIKLMIK